MGIDRKNENGGRGLSGGTSGAGRPSAIGVVGLFFGLVAGLAFLLAGVWIGMRPMGQMLHAAWEVRSWQPTPVEVLATALDDREGSEGGTAHAVQARYRYEFAGEVHESTRVGLDLGTGADNIGPWHQQWHERLRAARDGELRLLAWVNPRHPEQAVLDRQLRWRLLLVLTPFALVFPLVGLGLIVGCASALRAQFQTAGRAPGKGSEARPAQGLSSATALLTPRHRALAHWLVALFWCGIAFPVAGAFIDGRTPIWVQLFTSVFVVVGLFLLWEALRQTASAWRYGGSRLHIRPARPHAGQTLELDLRLSPRAAAAWHRRPAPRCCLSQFRLDESSSGAQEREVQCIEQALQVLHPGPAGLRLQARFEIPADAPPDGSLRSGERVSWRLSLRTDAGRTVLEYGLPVQAAVTQREAAARGLPQTHERGDSSEPIDPAGPGAPDRFARPAGPTPAVPIPPREPDAPPPELPEGVRWAPHPDSVRLVFAQKGWRWLGGIALLLLGGLLVAGRGESSSAPALLAQALLLALGLHGLTRHRALQVQDDGLLLERRSWVWTRRTSLPAAALDQLYHRLHHLQQYPGWQQEFHALYSRWPGRGGSTRLSPPLPGPQGAAALAHALQWAWAQRRGRFQAGARRQASPQRSGPGWGLLLVALLPWLLRGQ